MTIYAQYASLKNQIKTLTAEAKEMEPEVIKELGEEQLVKNEFGTFSITKKKTWTYPGYVKDAEKIFKEKKIEAEEKGDATFEEKDTLVFRAK